MLLLLLLLLLLPFSFFPLPFLSSLPINSPSQPSRPSLVTGCIRSMITHVGSTMIVGGKLSSSFLFPCISSLLSLLSSSPFVNQGVVISILCKEGKRTRTRTKMSREEERRSGRERERKEERERERELEEK
jgi:hypothetical protein